MISIITCGKEKERDFKEYERDLVKRVSPFSKLTILYVEKEDDLLKYLNTNKKLYLLDVDGLELTSKGFSNLLTDEDILFLIGPHSGFSAKFKGLLNNKATFLSLSRLTFPHRLCKIILLEQIYRGYCIQKGHPYAK